MAETKSNEEGIQVLNNFGEKNHEGTTHCHVFYNVSDYLGIFQDNIELMSEFLTRREEIEQSHSQYLAQHPELKAFLADYLQLLMHQKPEDVYKFTYEYFKA